MSGIQIILITGVIAIFIYYMFRLSNAVVDLFVFLLFTVLAVFFILSPGKTNVIAHKLGVGRGTDLLFYICVLFFFFIILKLLAHMRRIERKVTEIVRQQAKDNVRFMDNINEE